MGAVSESSCWFETFAGACARAVLAVPSRPRPATTGAPASTAQIGHTRNHTRGRCTPDRFTMTSSRSYATRGDTHGICRHDTSRRNQGKHKRRDSQRYGLQQGSKIVEQGGSARARCRDPRNKWGDDGISAMTLARVARPHWARKVPHVMYLSIAHRRARDGALYKLGGTVPLVKPHSDTRRLKRAGKWVCGSNCAQPDANAGADREAGPRPLRSE